MAGAHLREVGPGPGRRLAQFAGVLLAGMLVGGAGTVALDPRADARVDAAVASPTSLGASEPDEGSGTAAATPDPGPITLAFIGDINVERSLATRLDQEPDNFVGPFSDLLRSADLVVGNLEAALTTGGAPLNKEFTFRAPPRVLDALRAGGVDVVTIANNHGIDHGLAAFDETVAIKRAQPDGMVIGGGADEDEAYAPFVADVGGHTVAVIGATQVLDGGLIASWTAGPEAPGLASAKRVDRLVAEVAAARSTADTVVVFLHWGIEGEECPSASQRELARALVDAGADIVVGTHAHRVQGGGRLGEAVVHYGLGNFLFGTVSEASAKTGVFLVEIDGRDVRGYEWRPGRIVDRVPWPVDPAADAAARADWDALRGCTDLTP